MKLPIPDLDLNTCLREFDVWITASLGEIKDTERFREEMARVVSVFDALEPTIKASTDPSEFAPAKIADTFVGLIENVTEEGARTTLQSLASVLFLVTGKSDNNAKCQFPIHLLNEVGWTTITSVQGRRGTTPRLQENSIPRELKAEKYMGQVAKLTEYPDKAERLAAQRRLLEEYVSFILSDESYISQLWSLGQSYVMLKSLGRERDLLSPLIVFQVRGSVSASGGHDPESLLRGRLAEWGLAQDIDYNIADAVLEKTAGTPKPVEGEQAARVREKTRAFDFLLPYKTPGWQPKVFVQSQFYAGDSGSVSHKNVDQTRASRSSVLEVVKDVRFVEYLDGAGYFSSLNGDLKTLLSMPTTKSFFQVRTAAVRLRRELQDIGFLLPLELEHAILRSEGNIPQAHALLLAEGYSTEEIARCQADFLKRGLIRQEAGGVLSLTPERRVVARRYLLLDVVAIHGEAPSVGGGRLSGSLMVPGYGPFYGMKLGALAAEVARLAPTLADDYSDAGQTILADITWLCDEGLAMS